MGLYLMAVTWNLQLLVVILEVAFGLGMVIFIHELGHFAVAKWCGVKCEKFYLGFDIYGLKLAKFQWGETEYGIGILPLGGYVKMLGQDDNPNRAAQERERSLLHPAGGGGFETAVDFSPEPGGLDPRSYMAKSVPQRMAIISAGVIMNVIFAFALATAAYLIGVRDVACGISAVLPGGAAWKANLQPGDEFLQIDDSGSRPLRFRDLMTAVTLGDIQRGVDFEIKRQGVEKPFRVSVKPAPDKLRMRPTIGVAPPRTTQLSDQKPVIDGTPAAAVDAFEPGDTIVSIGDAQIHSYADQLKELTRHPGETLRFGIERAEKDSPQGEEKAVKHVDIEVPPRPMRTFGLVMKMGKIVAVQAQSPAAEADLRPDDFIVSIDGQPPADPLRLPELLRRRAGETVTVAITRKSPAGQDEKLEKQITLRNPAWPEESSEPGIQVSVPALGITYKVLNIVHQTDKESPAAEATLLDGDKPAAVPRFAASDEVVKAEIILPKKTAVDEDKVEVAVSKAPEPIEFSAENPNWAFFMNQVQWLPTGAKIKLTLKDGRTTTLELAVASDWFVVDRGLINGAQITTARATSLNEAMTMGWQETKDAVLQVYSFLRRIGTQVSPYLLGGPMTIAGAAGDAAFQGVAQLLIFLTMLSANLAVINFLPIPLLDGGHMVFLILEGILRRPVSEKVVVAFHYLGFVFIISLMVFVLGLDFGVIPRG